MEDVNALKSGGGRESYVLFVDSEKRNKAVWKTPSEYDITFSEPFKQVYSIELLDTTIPRTEYLVDAFNNSIQFQINNEDVVKVTLPEGDYDVQQFIQVLNTNLVSNNKYIAVSGVSDPVNVLGKLRFDSNFSFQLNMSQSSARTVLGFGNPIIPTLNPDIGTKYGIPASYIDGVSDDVFSSILDPTNVIVFPTFTGPNPVLDTIPIHTTSSVRQVFIAGSDGEVESISAAFTSNNAPASQVVEWSVKDVVGIEYASGNISPILDQFNSYATTDITDLNLNNRQPLLFGETYYLEFSSTNPPSNCYSIFHSQSNVPIQSTYNFNDISVSSNGATWSNVFPLDDLSCTVSIGGYMNSVTAPGVFQLTGERYVELHMKEIEEHIYASRAYEKYKSCVGRIQLANFGYANAPYHFTGLSGREFFPINVLPKIHVQFLRPDGQLYDFKGVPHYFTMCIKYYTPPSTITPTPSRLNPRYNPNATQYLVDSWTRENDLQNR